MNKKCKNCNAKFYSSKGDENCRPCRRELGLLTYEQSRRIAVKMIKEACGDAKDYKTEIIHFSIKQKWGLLTQLDYYKIADLYLKVACDSEKYSQNEPKHQVVYMLSDLRTLLMDFSVKKKRKVKHGKAVVEVVDGKVKRSWSTINAAAKELDISGNMVCRICNKVSKRRFYNLLWKKDFTEL